MRNIINILKYNFGKYHTGTSKILYLIGFAFLIINTFATFTNIQLLSEVMSLLDIAFIATFLGLNFIGSIIRFIRQISKEKGKLLFTFPIKGYEFLIAKILEFSIIQGAIAIVAYVLSLLSGNSLVDLIKLSSFSIMYGTIVAYVVVIAFIVIVQSYIKNIALSILTIVIGGPIISGIVDKIDKVITNLFPYFYIKIGNFIEIDIIYFVLSLCWIIFLIYLASYHLDKKLDII
ncbi:hypothetical protein H9660_10660 [Clostridium sp. Sa3CUN1]|uniref:ABC transporter permease n=1 Tax=Clostridium gallinarum TaxID=2762246 RepID=A0ABR8Q5A2_9CLOT|nr:hypothetical protein [Clostridium gallinarum]MBD7915606.1 hypothetical protein [Clostridium gallinarum]